MQWPARRVFAAGLSLQAGAVELRLPRARDYAPWAALRAQSQAFLRPWEPAWTSDELGRERFLAKLRRYHQDAREDRAYTFFVFRRADGVLLGGASLRHIRRGAAQACTLGYWVGERFARKGFTRAAVHALMGFAFEDLELHRMEASCMPENLPSSALLLQAGFILEGRASQYLCIDGEWRDHLLFGRVRAPDAGPEGTGPEGTGPDAAGS